MYIHLLVFKDYTTVKHIRRLNDLTDLTARLTVRADDGHALPLGSSGKVFSLTFILPSALVRFSVLSPIEPHVPPLVCPPAN